ncbi:hypothetical protein TNCV_4656381 [Trichonephila clavipes]|nr:hypothetical protein TNCV_4656381 [Trichonephila clavipes]
MLRKSCAIRSPVPPHFMQAHAELEVNENDTEELIMGHEDELMIEELEDELMIEELQEILNEEHQETQ